MSARSVTVSPAYGRDYKSAAAAIADWKAGKDFRLHATDSGPASGCCCSIADFPEAKATIRYSRMQRIAHCDPKAP